MMFDTLLCADWGKESKKRAVFMASVTERRIRRVVPPIAGWTLPRLVAAAREEEGKTLVAIDAPFGVPQSYLLAAGKSSFLQLIETATPSWFESQGEAASWSIAAPFFSVPSGDGALEAFVSRAAALNVQLRRRIDVQTGGRSVFITSGIPGSVGSAAIDLWRAWSDVDKTDLLLWPFQGALGSQRVTLGEIYPRVAYATALDEAVTGTRARMSLDKTNPATRGEAIDQLLRMEWTKRLKVTVDNTEAMGTNEDDFDAGITAAALLRSVLDSEPLTPSGVDEQAEGGILGTGAVDLTKGERPFRKKVGTPRSATPAKGGEICCPISGCKKVYASKRLGWDGHVGSLRLHPTWHPDVVNPEERKKLFRAQFPGFFA